jgi:hypothetical protein
MSSISLNVETLGDRLCLSATSTIGCLPPVAEVAHVRVFDGFTNADMMPGTQGRGVYQLSVGSIGPMAVSPDLNDLFIFQGANRTAAGHELGHALGFSHEHTRPQASGKEYQHYTITLTDAG